MTTAGGSIRIGTVNVGTLTGKLARVLDDASRQGVDILCVQETRLSANSVSAARAMAQSHGWQLLAMPAPLDSSGRPSGGLAVLARWDVDVFRADVHPSVLGRLQLVRIASASEALVLINVYGHSGDATAARVVADEALRIVASGNRKVVAIGDWNLTDEQAPISIALATGAARRADDIDVEDTGPTRHQGNKRGRRIDYAVVSERVVVRGRTRAPGPADHDMIMYDLEATPPKPHARRVAPKALGDDEDIEAAWATQWEARSESFERAVASRDLDGAWTILSNAAEDAWSGKGTRRRSAVPAPTVQQPPRRDGTLMPVCERRLRKLARQLRTATASRATAAAVAAASQAWQWAQARFPDLRDLFPEDEEAVAAVLRVADAVADQHRVTILHRWSARMQESSRACGRWITADVSPEQASKDVGSPVDAQGKAESAAEAWSLFWESQTAPDMLAFEELLTRVPTRPAPAVAFTAESLRRRVHAMRVTAAGADAWSAQALLRLPLSFYEGLSALWTAIWAGGEVPCAWREIRVVLIPKADGGLRPISVCSVLWRAGMTLAMRALALWTDDLFPASIVGGVHGRGATGLHAALHTAMLAALNGTAEQVAAAQLDVSKCFDSVHIVQALRTLQHVGAPAGLHHTLASFYQRQHRWLESRGAVATRPVEARRGLLQGCPASPFLLACLMTVWSYNMGTLDSSVQYAIYVDDRVLWTAERHAVSRLGPALQRAQELDAVLGFTWNAGKGRLVATSGAMRRELQQLGNFGIVGTRLTLLGVEHVAIRSFRAAHRDEAVRRVRLRCRRIAIALRNRGQRIAAVQRYVTPLISWAGAWTRPTLATIRRLQSDVERCVLGRMIPERSRALAWTAALSPWIDPAFALLAEVLRQYVWSVTRGDDPVYARSRRFRELLAEWDWSVVGPGVLATREGPLDVRMEGRTALHACARRAWEHALFRRESRCEHADLMPGTHPVLTAHVSWVAPLSNVNACGKVALAAAESGSTLFRLSRVPCPCVCGAENPSREHLTWQCPERLDTPITAPTTLGQRRLLVRTAPIQVALLPVFAEPEEHLVAAALSAARVSGRILIATDGSSVGRSHGERVASWAVAVGDTTWTGAVLGQDRTAGQAENFAAVHGLRLASRCVAASDSGVVLASDCLRLVHLLQRLVLGGASPMSGHAIWQECRRLMSDRITVAWVPAHGRHVEWEAEPSCDTAEWRRLNECADRAAGAVTERLWMECGPAREARAACVTWSRTAMALQWHGVRRYHEHRRATLDARTEP